MTFRVTADAANRHAGFLLSLVRGLMLTWVRCYTLRLDTPVADRRRGELASDVWEQISAADRQGLATWLTACELMLRLAMGVPADISWRIGQLGSHSRRGETMLSTARDNGLASLASALTVAAAVFWIVLALYSAAGEHISSTAEDIAFVLALVAAAALAVAGIAAGTRSAWQPAVLLLIAAVAVFALALLFAPTTW